MFLPDMVVTTILVMLEVHMPELAKWIGEECKECGKIESEDFHVCATTKSVLCSECGNNPLNIDEHTGLPHLTHFLKICDTCKKRTVGVRAASGEEKSSCINCRKNQT
jgi:hypothetical protein